MRRKSKAAPLARGGAGETSSDGYRAHLEYSTLGESVAIEMRKRGRACIIAKVVEAHPLGELVLAMPYRNRQVVECVSLPPTVLAYARQRGIRWWVVRLDASGESYGLRLDDVERLGWLRASDGRPEWFVSMSAFEPMAYQDWPYVQRTVTLDEEPEPRAVQGVLL
jgi:hypothetical protein